MYGLPASLSWPQGQPGSLPLPPGLRPRPWSSPAPTAGPLSRSMATGPRSSILTSPACSAFIIRRRPTAGSSTRRPNPAIPFPRNTIFQKPPSSRCRPTGTRSASRSSITKDLSGTSATSLTSPKPAGAFFYTWARLTTGPGSGSTGRRSASTREVTPASTAR